MKVLKFAVLLLVLGGIAIQLSSYLAQNPTSFVAERAKIVFVYKTTKGTIEFWNSITEGIEAAAKEYDVDYEIIGAAEETDISGNIDALLKAIEMKPHAIVLTATDYKQLVPYAKRAVDEGILLLTMDSDVDGKISRCFVATDNVLLGKLMGEEIEQRIPEQGRVGIIAHIEGSNSAISRVQGINSALGERAIAPLFCDNFTEKSYRQTLDLIASTPDLVGMVATNELSALGVAMAVEQLQLQDKIAVVTCDNSSKQIAYLEQGVIDATVPQRPFNMGYMSVQTAVKLLKGESKSEIPTFIDTGCEVITRENMFSIENQKLLFPFSE